jgi:hypothetical protein
MQMAPGGARGSSRYEKPLDESRSAMAFAMTSVGPPREQSPRGNLLRVRHRLHHHRRRLDHRREHGDLPRTGNFRPARNPAEGQAGGASGMSRGSRVSIFSPDW